MGQRIEVSGQPVGDERDALAVATLLGYSEADRPVLFLHDVRLALDVAVARGDATNPAHRAIVVHLIALRDRCQAAVVHDPTGL